jgi:hypothetical protein
MKNDFLPASEHFDRLLAKLDQTDNQAYWALMNTRSEEAYRGRTFVVYEYIRGQTFVLDHLTVTAFDCDDQIGASVELESTRTKRQLIVGYSPVRLFEHPVFLWLPTHAKMRWSGTSRDIDNGKGSLAFPLCIRTKSHLSLRERDVVYMETGPAYGREFERAEA